MNTGQMAGKASVSASVQTASATHTSAQTAYRAGTALSPGSNQARLRKACQDFESVFISMIMKQMMDSIPKASQSSAGSSMMQSLAIEPVAQHMTKSGGFGLADMLYQQMSRGGVTQGVLPDPPK